jgi:hypothetical protein
MLDTRGPTGAQSAVPEATSLHANLSMTFALRVKAPPNYSVYTAAAASAILGTISNSELTYYEIYIQNKQLRTDSSGTHTGHRYVSRTARKKRWGFFGGYGFQGTMNWFTQQLHIVAPITSGQLPGSKC